MDKIPFTVYDFFAYLSSGAVVLATADYACHFGLLGQKEVSPLLAITIIILAYVTGHIIGQFSFWLLESVVVARLLKRPISLLLGGQPRSQVLKLLFPGYFRPLPEDTQQRVRNQARGRKCSANDEALFLHIYPIVSSNERYQARQDVFLNQFGFARNMALAFIVSAVWLFLAHWRQLNSVPLRWPLLAAIGGLAMFYRYLKFFRQYSYELLIRYAELPAPETTIGTAPQTTLNSESKV